MFGLGQTNMERTLVWICLVFLSTIQGQDNGVRRPPTILVGPRNYIFKQEATIVLGCISTGCPQPTKYTWFRDGAELATLPPNVRRHPDPSIGNLTIASATILDQGLYQCWAENPHGRALSDIALLQLATLGSYGSGIKTLSVNVGDPLRIDCETSKSRPNATYSWQLTTDVVDQHPESLNTDQRRTIDGEGHLYITAAQMSDDEKGKLYKCNVFNPYLDLKTGGSYTRITVNPGTPKMSPPTVAFASEAKVIGLLGGNIHIRCLFNGYPLVRNEWRHNGQMIRHPQISVDGTNFLLESLQWKDEGPVVCKGTNNVGTLEKHFNLEINAVPYFKLASDRPNDVNVTEGDDVTVSCTPDAKPTASVFWFTNGRPLESNHPRRRLSADGRQLTLVNVCKDCAGGTSDLMVIQCNASNAFGYTFTAGYLNVLQRTKITNPPSSGSFRLNEDIELSCGAQSDPSTFVSFSWFLNREKMIQQPGRIFIDETAGRLRLVTAGDRDGGKQLAGNYTCVATNGYSTATADAEVTVDTSSQLPVASAEMQFAWWLIVLIAGILLLAIFLLLCCLFLQRNRGDTYPVDEKERKQGNDPVKELVDNGYHDYQRPEEKRPYGGTSNISRSASRSSIDDDVIVAMGNGDARKSNGHVMNNGHAIGPRDYGDDDSSCFSDYMYLTAGKFNEDGSFLGEYTQKYRRPPAHSIV